MRFFSLVDFQYMVIAFFLGIVASILVYIAWGSYPLHRKEVSEEEMEELHGHEIHTGHKAKKNPIAPLLIFVYVGITLWSIAYMVYTGIMKATAF